MSTARRSLVAEPLTATAWQPFGFLPVRDTDPLDGNGRLHYDLADVHVNVICHRKDEVPTTERGLVCEMFFRHLTHTQALLVLNTAAVIAVAPASCALACAADLGQVRAFRLERHDSLVLHAGVWHWGPFPLDEPQVDLFNVQGLRYAEDNTCAQVAALGGLEVVPS